MSNTNTLTFARKCDSCKKGMNEGYLIYGGEQYFCSDECLNTKYTPKEWEEMYADGEGESYWTNWYEDEHEYIINDNGEAIEM